MFTNSAQYYDEIYRQMKDYAAEAAEIAHVIRTHDPDARKILDCGCGTGEHARYLHGDHGFDVDGLDLDGETAPEGHYQITTRVIRGGTFENVQPLLLANIDSVSLGRYGQGLILNIRGGDTLSLSQVNRIL